MPFCHWEDRLPAVLAALAAALWLHTWASLAAAAAAPLPCDPAVSLEGDADLIARLAALLLRNGIAVTVSPACPAARAHVERQGSGLSVSILIRGERYNERLVDDVETAAAVIESWVRKDLSAPLLHRSAELSPIGLPPPPPTAPIPAPHPTRLVLGLTGEASVDNTGLLWLGANLHGCARVGPTCLGMIWRAAGTAYSRTSDYATSGRVATDLLASIDLMWQVHKVLLSPGLGLGLGWLQTTLTDSGQSSSLAQGGLRIEVRGIVSVPLGLGLALDLGIALGAALPQSGPLQLGVPRTQDAGDPPSYYYDQVPAAPWGMGRAEVGLRWSQR